MFQLFHCTGPVHELTIFREQARPKKRYISSDQQFLTVEQEDYLFPRISFMLRIGDLLRYL